MALAFTLTLAYLGGAPNQPIPRTAFAALYCNVASTLIRMRISAAVADHLGLRRTSISLPRSIWPARCSSTSPVHKAPRTQRAGGLGRAPHSLRAAFLDRVSAILFAFTTFTYVKFRAARAPFMVGAMMLGFVFVFLPSILTTPLAGRAVASFGTRRTMWYFPSAAGLGVPLMLTPSLIAVLIGMVLASVLRGDGHLMAGPPPPTAALRAGSIWRAIPPAASWVALFLGSSSTISVGTPPSLASRCRSSSRRYSRYG